ncbi:hypothetical protein KP509_38G028600 [Ceratopteris richardii]|uniref:Calcineurin-like phosphoesterase domain-containing protein n=1 Tax=Ceratopteris richardii TaxID=49495 RepID=A0A8T2Q3H1_CERRI|nr:hypothetical protein KP509_38G028600 [Ceratopteris richardii]
MHFMIYEVIMICLVCRLLEAGLITFQSTVSALHETEQAVFRVLPLSGWKHLFVGLDTSMKVGLRGPCNLFGHPTEEQLRKLDEELSQWDTCPPDNVTKLVFGHFPVSFTASAEHGSRLEYTLAKHSVGAYICGHLHKSFGPNLIHHHLLPKVEFHDCGNSTVNRKVEFWEWELGDWRKARTIRVIAIDQGHISFTDFSLSGLPVDAAHQREKWLPTLIVPTYPLDSYSMEQSAKPPYFMPSHDYVRSLIFSIQPPESVIARLYETTLGKLHLLEELEMVLKMKTGNSVYMYESPWQSAKYIDSANTQYSYKVSVVDVAGKVTESSLRSFSVQRKVSKLKKTWTEFLVMDLLWERAFVVLLRLALILFFILFICPKFILHFLLGNGRYEQWSYNLFRVGSQRLTVRRVFQLIAWFFIQGCTRTLIWWEQVFILLWLVLCPWFWGQVLGDGYPLGFMSIRGWMVQVNDSSPLYNDLGWPDILVIVIPYLYFVLLPLYFLIFTLSAEDFINKIDQVESSAVWQKKEKAFRTTSSEAKSSLPYKGLDKGEGGPFRCRWAWWIIMGGCLLVSVIHIGQVSAIAGAYGYMTVFASPGFAWPVPILMITTVFQSLSCRKH